MEKNYIKTKSKNGFKHKVRNKKINNSSLVSNHDFVKMQVDTVLSVPSAVSIERIKKFQNEYLQNSYWNTSKRGFDILFSSLVIIFVLSWVFPLFYILIKMESKGSLIFKQNRNGLNQKQFLCYKFRSMEVNRYSETLPTFKDDPRITRIGKFMRKYSIDELPQFINVLKGEMTIVGPRPHMVSETTSFNKISSNFYLRHQVKPGITGLAQINNCRGRIGCVTDLTNRLKYDLFYIKNASLLLDISIVYKTIIQMVFLVMRKTNKIKISL